MLGERGSKSDCCATGSRFSFGIACSFCDGGINAVELSDAPIGDKIVQLYTSTEPKVEKRCPGLTGQ